MDEIKIFVEQQFTNKPKKDEFVGGITPIGIADAQLGLEETEALVRASLDLKIVDGKLSHAFELELARFLGVRYVTTCNSGSSANLLAFMSLTSPKLGSRAIQVGDEVIVAAVGFPTTVAPIIQFGAVPVFVDVSLVTYNPTPKMIAEAITDKTKAIFLAHTLGNPIDLDAIKEIAWQNELWLIEDNCFVAGTKILTSKGEVPIEKVKIGDLVMTRDGYKKVTNSGKTGEREVITKLGLTATPDHPIITERGVVPLDALRASDIIYVWKKNTSSITKQSTQDTQIQVDDTCKSTIGQALGQRELPYIVRFGKMLLEKFQKANIFTTLMETLSTINWTILDASPVKSTANYTLREMTTEETLRIKTLMLQENLQRYGIRVQKGNFSTSKLPKILGKIEQLIQLLVRFVEKNFKLHFQPEQKIVLPNVSGKVEVYNLTVENSHEFFANGILVHNCDAFGSEYNGKKTGTIGDISTTSFYPAHMMTTGEGGAVFTDNAMLNQIVRSLRDWGRECWCLPNRDNTCGKRFTQKDQGELPDGFDHKYIYSHVGYNLKSTDLQASIGLEQLKKLPSFIERRRHNWQFLRDTLVGCNLDDYFLMPEATPKSDPAWFGFILTIKKDMPFTRKELLDFLAEKKIATRNLFGGNLTRQPAFLGKGRIADELTNTLPKADIVMNQTFWLGVHPGITEDMIDWMADCLVEFTDRYK